MIFMCAFNKQGYSFTLPFQLLPYKHIMIYKKYYVLPLYNQQKYYDLLNRHTSAALSVLVELVCVFLSAISAGIEDRASKIAASKIDHR